MPPLIGEYFVCDACFENNRQVKDLEACGDATL